MDKKPEEMLAEIKAEVRSELEGSITEKVGAEVRLQGANA